MSANGGSPAGTEAESALGRILLVDDDELVRRIVRVVLEAEGYSVAEAEDGPGALAEISRQPCEAVILDLLIPGMNGYEICAAMKKQAPETKVLVLTSIPAAEAGSEATAVGADDVATKPFSVMDLLQRLSDLLGS